MKNRCERNLSPEQALLHPIWLVSLAVLVVNDHILKESVAAGAVTGKLSDFAGLIVAPILVATLLRLKSRTGVWMASGAVMSVFATINVWPAAASVWDGAMSTIWPWVTTVDPTDLIAIPFALVAIGLVLPSMEQVSANRGRRVAQAGLATVAGMASIATSQPPPECEFGDCGFTQETQISSRVSLLNRTHELHAFRVSGLRSDLVVDCGELERDPNAVLGRGAFTNATLWFVQSGQEIALTDGEITDWGEVNDADNRDCHAVLVESETAPDVLVVWNNQFNFKTFSFDAEIPKELRVSPGTVVLEADYSNTPDSEIKEYRMRTDCGSRAENCAPELLEPLAEIPTGARYTWNSRGPNDSTFHHPRPAEQFDRVFDPEPFCETPGPGEGLAWTSPPLSTFIVEELEEGEDGCHVVKWSNGQVSEPSDWWLCAPIDSLAAIAPDEGSAVEVTATNLTPGGGLYNGLELIVIRRDIETESAIDRRRIFMTRGFGLEPTASFDFEIEPREGCEAQIRECGTASLPADVDLIGYETRLRPGESTTIGTIEPREIHLVRANLNPVYDPTCDESMMTVNPPANEPPAYLEVVVVRE